MKAETGLSLHRDIEIRLTQAEARLVVAALRRHQNTISDELRATLMAFARKEYDRA